MCPNERPHLVRAIPPAPAFCSFRRRRPLGQPRGTASPPSPRPAPSRSVLTRTIVCFVAGAGRLPCPPGAPGLHRGLHQAQRDRCGPFYAPLPALTSCRSPCVLALRCCPQTRSRSTTNCNAPHFPSPCFCSYLIKCTRFRSRWPALVRAFKPAHAWPRARGHSRGGCSRACSHAGRPARRCAPCRQSWRPCAW